LGVQSVLWRFALRSPRGKERKGKIMDMNKFKKLVHYICWSYSSSPSKLGAVKLNKALWLSDLTAYYALGHPITGARYIKREFGPVPKPILPVIRELVDEGVLTVQETLCFGKTKREFIVHRDATEEFMTDAERTIVKDTIEFVCEKHTATSISSASHDHIWKAAVDGEEIPHFTVFAQPGTITPEDRIWALGKIENAC